MANAGHRPTALRVCTPAIETVVEDRIVRFSLVLEFITNGRILQKRRKICVKPRRRGASRRSDCNPRLVRAYCKPQVPERA
jgi:hypothetical protein